MIGTTSFIARCISDILKIFEAEQENYDASKLQENREMFHVLFTNCVIIILFINLDCHSQM